MLTAHDLRRYAVGFVSSYKLNQMRCVTEYSNVHELVCHQAEWRDLANHAVEQNVFYEPAVFLPAFQHLSNEKVKVLLVWSDDHQKLIGLYPLEKVNRYRILPISHYRMWEHMHCYLGTPLVRRGYEEECLSKFFRWLELNSEGPFFEFRLFQSEGAFHRVLQNYILKNKKTAYQSGSFSRAILHPSKKTIADFEQRVSGKRLKEYRRQYRRLSEKGALGIEECIFSVDVNNWIDRYLALELRGWKGKAGSAFATDEVQRQYFQQLIQRAHESGKIELWQLLLDGEPIAMMCHFLSERHAFAFKTTYDERFGKYSPGMLLKLEASKQMIREGKIDSFDSCVGVEESMIDHLWKRRRTVEHMTVATGKGYRTLLLYMVLVMRGLLVQLRSSQRLSQSSRERSYTS